MKKRMYIAIDLKAFYASVECIERGLNPLTAHLVVADESRTSKTICLAVSPALKSHGIGGRPRLFEVIRAVEQANTRRKYRAPQRMPPNWQRTRNSELPTISPLRAWLSIWNTACGSMKSI